MTPEKDTILYFVDSDRQCSNACREFFLDNGFLVITAESGLECVAKLAKIEPDVLVIALDIPWGGGDGVIARLNDGLSLRKEPLVYAIGDAPAEILSERTGLAPYNCFSKPLCKDALLDRIGIEYACRMLRNKNAKTCLEIKAIR
jgi:FixJ family two-component response regulator